MRVHWLQHVPFEGLGSIAAWLESRNAETSRTRMWTGGRLPPLHGIDWLVIMGGPMSVNDEERHPWLVHEKRFIAEAIAQDKTVLGICLGAQLIASSLGARVRPNREREIGWYPIEPIRQTGSIHFADLVPAPHVQPEIVMLNSTQRFLEINTLMSKLLDRLDGNADIR